MALVGIISQCIVGAKVISICEFGHTVIMAGVSKLYTKKVNGVVIDRGIAFPVCISVNDVVCHHSPLLDEERVSHFCVFVCIPRRTRTFSVNCCCRMLV